MTRSRDALAAERRRMPWLAVDKKYEFDGTKGKVSLLDLFEGRRQLIVYRAFFEPGVFGWPEHACRGCSFGADQVAHLAHSERPRHHLGLRLTRAAGGHRAPVKARMDWDDALVHHHRQLRHRTSASMNGTATTCSSATASGCSAHTSSTTAATRPWEAPGATSTSLRSAVRRSGRLARGLPSDPAVQVVELARHLRRRGVA